MACFVSYFNFRQGIEKLGDNLLGCVQKLISSALEKRSSTKILTQGYKDVILDAL